eukprot:m.213601 g.213601  ORF g.213601 m.213601 type:complete len:130 (+) comp19059_c0_seq2:249-638(+)
MAEAEMMMEIVPSKMSKMRACLACSLVKTEDQFYESGCDNCEKYLAMAQDAEKVSENTSSNFKGLCALMDPRSREDNGSWVAAWLRLDKLKPGVYALSVTGQLPPDSKSALDDERRQYINRDRSKLAAK